MMDIQTDRFIDIFIFKCHFTSCPMISYKKCWYRIEGYGNKYSGYRLCNVLCAKGWL